MQHSQHPTASPSRDELIDESELAARLKTTVASVRWMRRAGRITYIKIAGNRKVRFNWHQVLEDLRASEVCATVPNDERARQLADITTDNDDDAAACAAADRFRELGAP